MLTVKRGLPLSRLLLEESNSKAKFKEESASPRLKARGVKVKLEKKEECDETHTVTVKEEKKEESHSRKKASTSGSKFSTLRSFPTGEIPPSSQPLPHRPPCFPHPPVLQPPLFTPLWVHQQFGQMPAPNWVICGGCQMLGTLVPFWAVQ